MVLLNVHQECESSCKAIGALLETISKLEQENAKLKALLIRKNAGEDIAQEVIDSGIMAEETEVFLRNATILDLDLSARAYNALERHCWSSKDCRLKRNSDGLITVASLAEYRLSDLFELPMLGQKGLTEIYESLKRHGIVLSGGYYYEEEVRFKKLVGEM